MHRLYSFIILSLILVAFGSCFSIPAEDVDATIPSNGGTTQVRIHTRADGGEALSYRQVKASNFEEWTDDDAPIVIP